MVIVDSGFWIALANKQDDYHQRARTCFPEFQQEGFITTWCVITEACYLLQREIGIDAPTTLLNKVGKGTLHVFELTQAHCPDVIRLMNQYRDLPMDLADASLVILAEHLGHGRILSVDQRDFNTYRWKNTKPFHNLLIP